MEGTELAGLFRSDTSGGSISLNASIFANKGPKAWQGLMALVCAGRWRRHDHIVFIHTGGAPAPFAYREVLSLY